MKDSATYQKKKRFFESMITLYGRNAVEEVLDDPTVEIHALHLAESNKQEGVIERITAKARARGVEIRYHAKAALSRISRNAKQDQGVALDIIAPTYRSAETLLETPMVQGRLLALDGIHNPQNLGMIIRSAAAGNIDGILLPKQGSAKLSPLVMKASAGTLFKLPVYYCETLPEILGTLQIQGWSIFGLSSHADATLHTLTVPEKTVFVLGNESEGVSEGVAARCNAQVAIPMQRGVESLNVAVTAALLAFLPAGER
ncbi:RNA methyltransferase [Sulfurimonas sp. HSL-1656]|uniref:TrmH family RNA methyltransferase n=1 Tax=Thiomicrolovo subterrani TaxID=3131934 RepID=UPI0031F9F98E